MNILENKVDLAIQLSKENHKGQLYGDKDYFDYHIKGVIDTFFDDNVVFKMCQKYERIFKEFKVKEFKIDSKECLQTLYLHDIVEDTSITLDDLKKYGFSDNVIDAVDRLTYKKDIHTREEYYDIISISPLASLVKVSDATFNRNNAKFRSEKYFYYQHAITRLS